MYPSVLSHSHSHVSTSSFTQSQSCIHQFFHTVTVMYPPVLSHSHSHVSTSSFTQSQSCIHQFFHTVTVMYPPVLSHSHSHVSTSSFTQSQSVLKVCTLNMLNRHPQICYTCYLHRKQSVSFFFSRQMTHACAEKTSSPRHIGGRFRTNSSFYPTRPSSIEILTGIWTVLLANVSRSRIYIYRTL